MSQTAHSLAKVELVDLASQEQRGEQESLRWVDDQTTGRQGGGLPPGSGGGDPLLSAMIDRFPTTADDFPYLLAFCEQEFGRTLTREELEDIAEDVVEMRQHGKEIITV